MSIEIKCDRCGKPVKPLGDGGPYASRVSNNNFEVLRDGKLELHDLCDNCLRKLDIFMGGKMPEQELKSDLVYIRLFDPKVSILENQAALPGDGYELNISSRLDLFEKALDAYYIPTLSFRSVEDVMLGVRFK